MKMYHIDNLDAFLDQINRCKGDVYVLSKDGDKLNLKSKLTQFVALSALFQSSYINELELQTTNEEDTKNLINFMMSGNGIC